MPCKRHAYELVSSTRAHTHLVVESLADFEERVDGQQRIRASLVHGPDALCADVLADLLEATVEAVHPMDCRREYEGGGDE